MIVFAEGEPKGGRYCPNCGYNESTGWSWDDEAYGHDCPKCGTMVSAETGSIIEQRVEATVFYKDGKGWMIKTTFHGGTTINGPFVSKENAISEAKKDNPNEILVLDR